MWCSCSRPGCLSNVQAADSFSSARSRGCSNCWFPPLNDKECSAFSTGRCRGCDEGEGLKQLIRAQLRGGTAVVTAARALLRICPRRSYRQRLHLRERKKKQRVTGLQHTLNLHSQAGRSKRADPSRATAIQAIPACCTVDL